MFSLFIFFVSFPFTKVKVLLLRIYFNFLPNKFVIRVVKATTLMELNGIKIAAITG